MKNAASNENRDMSDDMAYSGTMSIIRITILRHTMSYTGQSSTRDWRTPLQYRLPVILYVHKNGDRGHSGGYEGGDSGEGEEGRAKRGSRAWAMAGAGQYSKDVRWLAHAGIKQRRVYTVDKGLQSSVRSYAPAASLLRSGVWFDADLNLSTAIPIPYPE